MTRKWSQFSGAALAVVAIELALAAVQTAPPAAVAPVAPDTVSGETPVAPDRAARLDAQRQQAEAQLAAMHAFGQEPRFTAALKTVVDANPGDPESLPFQPVKAGCVPLGAFTSFVRWQSRASESGPLVAVDFAIANHPFAAIVDFDRQLRERGLELLVVLLPSRLEIYPELVCELPATGFAGMGEGTQRFVAELARGGVEAISLVAPLVAARFGELPADQVFLRTDPHLTPRGYEVAAMAVAERLAELPSYQRGTLVEGRDFRVEPREFGYKPGDTLIKRGSELEPVRGNALFHCGEQRDQLFDVIDPEAPIVVLGDSNARLHSATACDFCSQLARFTGQKVDVLKADGGAADQTRRKLGRREPERWKTMKTIVWLVPETILVPALRWKTIPLEQE